MFCILMNTQKDSSLKKDGLKVNIYDKKRLKKLGMHALLVWDKEV